MIQLTSDLCSLTSGRRDSPFTSHYLPLTINELRMSFRHYCSRWGERTAGYFGPTVCICCYSVWRSIKAFKGVLSRSGLSGLFRLSG